MFSAERLDLYPTNSPPEAVEAICVRWIRRLAPCPPLYDAEAPYGPRGLLSSADQLVISPGHSFAPIRETACFYRWLLEARGAFFASTARLHAKCVIADRSTALITSANLTSAGINDNIELGILIEAGPLPGRLQEHLELLMEDGTFEEVSV